jgi:ATP-dependent Clp protease adaptor protein ClpS
MGDPRVRRAQYLFSPDAPLVTIDPMADSQTPDLNTRERVLADSRADQQLERPRMWRVLLHNDDYTTQDFVVWVLETVFHKPRAEALAIMLSVHQSGLGVAGVYTYDVAETKLQATKDLAEQHEFPLLVTMEPEAESRNEHRN